MNGWLSSEALRIHVVEAAENVVAKEAAKREQLRDREDCADADWSAAHTQMLNDLINISTSLKKQLIFNNNGFVGKAGQLFERWGSRKDHDNLMVEEDMKKLEILTGAGSSGQVFSLARSGGGNRDASPEPCGAGLASRWRHS